jgi:hypothetical protein
VLPFAQRGQARGSRGALASAASPPRPFLAECHDLCRGQAQFLWGSWFASLLAGGEHDPLGTVGQANCAQFAVIEIPTQRA